MGPAKSAIKTALRAFCESDGHASALSDGQVRTLRALVHPEIRLADRPAIPAEASEGEPAMNVDIAVLDLRQERHARTLGSGHRLIYGVAGLGKTVLLVARARFLAREHREQLILFLCFNVTLAAYLRNKLLGCTNVAVHHFDEWSTKNLVTRGDEEKDDALGERLLSRLQQGGDAARVYDTVLIDEAQDFASNWFRCVLAAMKDPLDGDLVIVSDASQGLYRRTGVSWQGLGIRARGRTVHVGFDLDKNYRNTREIVELARHFASPPTEGSEDDVLCVAVDPSKARRSIGIRPVLFKEAFRSAECSRVVDLVRGLLSGRWLDRDLPTPLVAKEVGILYPMIPKQERNEFRCFLERLRALGLVVWLTDPKEDNRKKVNEPGIKVQTIHSAKGLEYRAVIVMWADLLPRVFFKDCNEQEERRFVYVALTRASDFLAITYSRPSRFIDEIRQSGAAVLR
jgi:superfamily I DNA and RNA helicase